MFNGQEPTVWVDVALALALAVALFSKAWVIWNSQSMGAD